MEVLSSMDGDVGSGVLAAGVGGYDKHRWYAEGLARGRMARCVTKAQPPDDHS